MSDKHHAAGIDSRQNLDSNDETKRNIGIFLRVRPSSELSEALSVAEDMHGVQIRAPRSTDQGYGIDCFHTHTVSWPVLLVSSQTNRALQLC